MSKRVYSGNSRTSRWRYKKKLSGLNETLTPDTFEFAAQQAGEEENEVQQQLKFQNELLSEFYDRGGTHQQNVESLANDISKEVGSVPDQGLSKDEVFVSGEDVI